MKLSDLGETGLLERLARLVPGAGRGEIGIGDDCAVVRGPKGGEDLVLKTDAIVEGVHYLPEHPPNAVGWKALCRVLSDLAATGATPRHALVCLGSRPDAPAAYWEGVYRGIARAARRFGVAVVGGETVRCETPFLCIMGTGTVPRGRAIRRDRGRAGDILFVTGRLGGSLRGRHLKFQPRVHEGLWLAGRKGLRAMMDLSDGLASDLPRLAAASGTGFAIEAALPAHPGCDQRAAFSDGEDYELLLAVAPRSADALLMDWSRRFPRLPLTRIGRLTAKGHPTRDCDGFDHFLRLSRGG